MKAELIPMEIAMAVLAELLYGIGYNAAVAVAFKHRLLHVSVSVVIGVFGTLLIPALIWFDLTMPFWQSGLLLLASFAASGTPMVIGSMRRTMQSEDRSHCLKRWKGASYE